MRYRISFEPRGVSGVPGVELEAAGYDVLEGRLILFAMISPLVNGPTDMKVTIVEYAPRVWRSVAAVGAFTEATAPPPTKETPGADPRRRQAG